MIDCFDREIWDGAPREVELVYRVIQWGAGNNAQALIRAVHQHPDLELVGCRVWSEEKDGIDVGVLAGIGPIGISATSDAQSLVDIDADVVLFLPAMLPDTTESDREAIELLRSGKSVISLTGDHSMPAAAGNGFGEACRIGGSTFTAAGVNPGCIAERLAPTLTGLHRRTPGSYAHRAVRRRHGSDHRGDLWLQQLNCRTAFRHDGLRPWLEGLVARVLLGRHSIGAGIPMIPEVIKVAPGILLPKIQAPFRRRLTG